MHTWKGRILPVARSKATASQSRTTDCVPSFSTPGSTAAMSGYFTVMFSLLRLQHHSPKPYQTPISGGSGASMFKWDTHAAVLVVQLHHSTGCKSVCSATCVK